MSLQKIQSIGTSWFSTGESRSQPAKSTNFLKKLMTELIEIKESEDLSPKEVEEKLNRISKVISDLPEVPAKLLTLHETVYYKSVFPIMGELYGRN